MADNTTEQSVEQDIVNTCEVEWEHPKNAICNPHSCDLPKYHEGPHECSCGWKRRLMYRDEPERFDKRLR